MYYFRYPVDGEDGSNEGEDFLPVATTRPETILGDTAVAVHPEDPRFARFVGRRCRFPLTDRCRPSSFHKAPQYHSLQETQHCGFAGHNKCYCISI